MRTIKFLLVILFGIAVGGCGGGGGYGGGSSGGSTGYSISGTISGSAQNPTESGVTVTLSGAANQVMTTSTGGAYSFSGLANGNYTVTPSQNLYRFTPASAAVTVYNTNSVNDNFTESP